MSINASVCQSVLESHRVGRAVFLNGYTQRIPDLLSTDSVGRFPGRLSGRSVPTAQAFPTLFPCPKTLQYDRGQHRHLPHGIRSRIRLEISQRPPCGLAQFPVNRPGFVSQPIQNHLYLAVELRTGRPIPLKCCARLRFPGSTHRIGFLAARFAWPLTFPARPNRATPRRRAGS